MPETPVIQLRGVGVRFGRHEVLTGINLSIAAHETLGIIGESGCGKTVLLKPNLVEFDPSTAINTDPRLVAAAVVAFRRLGAASVTVGEGPGHRRDTEYVVSRSGLLDALHAVEAPFVDLNTAPLMRRPLRSRFTDLRELWLPEVVVRSDVVVSMPKMKTHHWGGVTLSLKNCFGCVPGRVYGWPKNVLHWAGLEQSIVDVAAAVRPDIAIVDGIVGMDGNGPISGEPKNAGLTLLQKLKLYNGGARRLPDRGGPLPRAGAPRRAHPGGRGPGPGRGAVPSPARVRPPARRNHRQRPPGALRQGIRRVRLNPAPQPAEPALRDPGSRRRSLGGEVASP